MATSGSEKIDTEQIEAQENIATDTGVDLSRFQSQLSFKNKVVRGIWGIAWILLFRISPRICFGWRRFLLKLFGARIGKNVRIYNSARIYYPPNLCLEDNAVVGPDVDVYCVAPITVKANAMISQYSFLCAASHDHRQPSLPLIAKPIVIESQAWVCAGAFVGPGVTIGKGAVVGARAVTFKDVEAWTIVAGNPAVFVKDRVLDKQDEGSVN